MLIVTGIFVPRAQRSVWSATKIVTATLVLVLELELEPALVPVQELVLVLEPALVPEQELVLAMNWIVTKTAMKMSAPRIQTCAMSAIKNVTVTLVLVLELEPALVPVQELVLALAMNWIVTKTAMKMSAPRIQTCAMSAIKNVMVTLELEVTMIWIVLESAAKTAQPVILSAT